MVAVLVGNLRGDKGPDGIRGITGSTGQRGETGPSVGGVQGYIRLGAASQSFSADTWTKMVFNSIDESDNYSTLLERLGSDIRVKKSGTVIFVANTLVNTIRRITLGVRINGNLSAIDSVTDEANIERTGTRSHVQIISFADVDVNDTLSVWFTSKDACVSTALYTSFAVAMI